MFHKLKMAHKAHNKRRTITLYNIEIHKDRQFARGDDKLFDAVDARVIWTPCWVLDTELEAMSDPPDETSPRAV